jgi:aldose 1-epimerase
MRDAFGTTADGEAVERVTIRGGGLTARLLSYGATLQDLRLEGHDAPLVLGFETLGDYEAHNQFFGAVVGRYANRIGNGRFRLDGELFELDRNDGDNILHGGTNGFHRRVWTVRDAGPDFVSLGMVDPSGTMGFPGTVDISATFRLLPQGRLVIEMIASCDQPTLVNLAHHSYFNLDDGGVSDVLEHRLSIEAQAYLPVDAFGIPTGEVLPVKRTEFDFLMPRQIGESVNFDHNYCIAAARGPLKRVAWAQGASSGVEMDVWSTEPGLQFYAGQHIDAAMLGLEGRRYRPQSGFCLEPQLWPDSPNRPYFPQAVLRPGETYRQVSEYRFRMPPAV